MYSTLSGSTYIYSTLSDSTYIYSTLSVSTYTYSTLSDNTYINSPLSDSTYIYIAVSDSTYIYSTISDSTYIYSTLSGSTYLYSTLSDFTYIYSTLSEELAPSFHSSFALVLFTHNAFFCKLSSASSGCWYAAGCCVGLKLHLISGPADTQWTLLPRVGVCMWGSFDKMNTGCWHNWISCFGNSHHYHYHYHHHHHHHPVKNLGL
jgi:hypothetical protein